MKDILFSSDVERNALILIFVFSRLRYASHHISFTSSHQFNFSFSFQANEEERRARERVYKKKKSFRKYPRRPTNGEGKERGEKKQKEGKTENRRREREGRESAKQKQKRKFSLEFHGSNLLTRPFASGRARLNSFPHSQDQHGNTGTRRWVDAGAEVFPGVGGAARDGYGGAGAGAGFL